jgi:YidC/Oxa1 family membrane protein insertase
MTLLATTALAALLAAVYAVVPNYGVAILVLSILWMLLISPLTLKSTRSMLAMQKLQPKLKQLQQQHKDDRQAFAAAQMELFKEHGVSPFGSCLPTLLPLPVFFALFEVIENLSHKVHGVAVPEYLSPSTLMYKNIVHAHGALNAFGLDLAKSALSSHASVLTALPYFVLLLVMMATQYFQTVMMMSKNPQAQQNPQMKMMKFLPLVFGAFCIRFPAGVVLYYAMSNLCRIGQQYAMYKFDPKVKALVAQEVVEVEAKTRDIDYRRGGAPVPATVTSSGTAGTAVATPSTGRTRFRDLLSGMLEPGSQSVANSASKPPGSTTGRARGGSSSSAGAGAGRGGAPPANGQPSPGPAPLTGAAKFAEKLRASSRTVPPPGAGRANGSAPSPSRSRASTRSSPGAARSGAANQGHRTNRKRRRR